MGNCLEIRLLISQTNGLCATAEPSTCYVRDSKRAPQSFQQYDMVDTVECRRHIE